LARYFVHITYLGTNYRGWQRQINTGKCVQDTIEASMSLVLKRPVKIIGCGRTDAGVHAQQFYFHFDDELGWDFDLVKRLNFSLPNDIKVWDIVAVQPKSHARYDATMRTYEFYLQTSEHPYNQQIVTPYPIADLNHAMMQKAAESLVGTHDFAHLCIAPLRAKTTICVVNESTLTLTHEGHGLVFRISANRFLKSMIRIIMARLIALGEGRMNYEQFISPLPNTSIIKHKTMMHPQGLHLVKVVYPFLDLPTRSFGV
jgi:tRNA pseudouridine38-40 synthase